MKDWVKVYANDDPIKVEMLRHLLADQDIDSVVLNKKDSAYGFGDVELHVPRELAMKALHLIEREGHE